MNIETKTKRKFVWIVGLACLFGVLLATTAQAQVKVGNNPTTIDANSALEIESTDKALYLPRLSTTDLAAVSGWKEGMMVYNTDDDCIKVYDGTSWECVGITTAQANAITANTAKVTDDDDGVAEVYGAGWNGDGKAPTKNDVYDAIQALTDDDGIYDGSGSLSGATTVTMAGNNLNFTSTGGDFNVDANTLVVDASANRVGIGTASPSAVLEIENAVAAGTDNYSLSLQNTTTALNSNVGAEFLVNSFGSAGAKIKVNNDGGGSANLSFVVRTSGTDNTKMFIDGSTGNIGIGTTDPGANLEVTGDVRLSNPSSTGYYWNLERNNSTGDFVVSSALGGAALDLVTIEPDGDFGIGTSTPKATLDVNGSVAFATVNVASNRTIGANDHFIIKTGNGNYAMTLPNPASFPGRVLQFVNGTASGNITFAGYTPIGSITQLNPRASGAMISNGSKWYWYSSF